MTCSPSATRRPGTPRRGTSSSSVWRPRTRRASSAPKSGSIADALCRRILPQTNEEDAVSLVALLDAKLLADHGDGFREASMPYMREAWRRGLAAIDGEAKARHDGRGFAVLADRERDALLRSMQSGEVNGDRWSGLDAKAFFDRRILVDVPALFYSHPKSWNEIGFGGPASPRGYVRLDGDRLDPWEGGRSRAGTGMGSRRAKPACRLTQLSPARHSGSAPDIFRVGGLGSDAGVSRERSRRFRHRRHRRRRRNARRTAG